MSELEDTQLPMVITATAFCGIGFPLAWWLAFLGACSVWIVARGRRALWACVALVTASALLALLPDASQALGLLVAMAVVLVRCRYPGWLSGSTLGVAALTTAWAFLQPDPLQPLPHVEEVFALAFAHSWLIGVAVLASSIWLVVGLHARASRAQPWLSAVAAYYGVLFRLLDRRPHARPFDRLRRGPGGRLRLAAGSDCDFERRRARGRGTVGLMPAWPAGIRTAGLRRVGSPMDKPLHPTNARSRAVNAVVGASPMTSFCRT